MFRPMRRNNQKLKSNECMDIIEKSPRGVLAVLGDEEYPYTIPLDYVYDNGNIYFHGALEGHKVDSVTRHDKVSFCIVDEGIRLENQWWLTFKSVICFGKISKVVDKKEIGRILELFGDKYFPDSVSTQDELDKYIDDTLILKLNIEHVSGKLVREK
ncbi:MAG: hypothetical protein BZ133_02890 [Methanosphaera sp. SHI613]|nr:MAG: hypothetical protein BZ133_02890 [Methanosphaera sp. SHI613]